MALGQGSSALTAVPYPKPRIILVPNIKHAPKPIHTSKTSANSESKMCQKLTKMRTHRPPLRPSTSHPLTPPRTSPSNPSRSSSKPSRRSLSTSATNTTSMRRSTSRPS
ncbi:hypothetical protein FJTKL_14814 [Diaporthe vaccinii]|uniref:Uncharacterized protein n=1 Tax=Diaporthe vaccinii TaxID=105482 RepID=A0ABR4F825_9PEZI